ncbi:hypothetical protein FHS43_001885 [Streptosporangium becharense]|uniref:Uncharacterized protein n=1 Tax=Streptosporangium becharense TaxID=1816182 RepID=A0A7W9MEK2_9ACTN|nr:hypothetical protein [Streptosporangium becharense]MBB5817318.1 hypothetical protein [Streptosporangium becharense]
MSLVSYWSIVPVFLKPDALEGENSVMPGRRAADFAMFLAAGLDEPDRLAYDPCFPESAAGAGLARRHVAGESGAFSWYEWPPADVPGCQRRLAELHAEWAGLPSVDVPRIVTRASAALGFEVTQVTDMILTLDDYMVFYGDTPRPDLHPRMQRYLVDRPIRLLMMCGKQQNSALQAMKTYLRRVLVHHSGRSSDGGNLIHVTNPDASNYPELMRFYLRASEQGSAAGGSGQSAVEHRTVRVGERVLPPAPRDTRADDAGIGGRRAGLGEQFAPEAGVP